MVRLELRNIFYCAVRPLLPNACIHSLKRMLQTVICNSDDIINVHGRNEKKYIYTLMTYPYIEGMVNQFHPHELKLNTANPKPPFWINFFLLQINLFLLSFMINAMTLVLI